MKIVLLVFATLTFSVSGNLANSYAQVQSGVNNSAVNLTAYNSDSQNLSDESQQIRIIGTVTDERGGPLPGVTVLVKGTLLGAVTDATGKYALTNAPQNAILLFSFVGMTTQEIASKGRMLIDVVLKEEAIGLEEVVVIGYGTQKKINLTGAVSNVDAKFLESRPITNLGQGLQGTVSNLNITQASGALGTGSSFNIRGNTSITGGSPLVLVNGIPMDVNLLNPNDIDNVTVLKDAASAAIYGARAAYGVILVTTKAGKQKDRPSISLSTSFSRNEPTVVIEWTDTMDRIKYLNEANMRVNGTNYFDALTMEAMTNHYNDPVNYPNAIIHPNNASEWTNVANEDWNKILMNESYPMQQHTASVSGSSDKFDYYTSVSYMYQEGLVNEALFDEHYKRHNIMTNLNYDVFKWATIGTKISINNSFKRFAPNDPHFRNCFAENATIYQTNVYSTMPNKYPDGNWSHTGSIENPAQMLSEGGHQTRKINDVWVTGILKLTPIEGMTVNFDYSSNIRAQNELAYIALQPFYNASGQQSGYYGGSNPNRVTKTNYNNEYYVINAYADYTKTFSEKHYFKAMIGFNQENAIYTNSWAERRNLIINEIPYVNLASGDAFVGDYKNEYAIRGAFTRLNYIFDDRYLFEVNSRYDGTSKFAKADRFALFPSLSVGWRIDNEAFFAGLKNVVSLLKFRVSYGDLGNQAVTGYYPYIATLSAGIVPYLINGEPPMSIYSPGLVSPTLTWETVTQQDFGVDFGFFQGKLSGTFDIYRRDTKNMLTRSQTLAAVLAVTEPQANAADMKTTGFDLSLEWKHNIGNVRYGVTAILSDYQSEITKFSNPSGIISDYYIGYKMGQIWGLTTGGLFQTDEAALVLDQTNIAGRKRQAGDIWFVDMNGDGKINRGKQTLDDHGDMSIIGNSTPRYSYGIRPNISWKGFDLDVFLQGVAKRDLVINTLYFLTQYSNEWVGTAKISTDYWSPENPDAYYPRPIISGAGDVTATQTRFMQNAAYLRLKQLTFSYNIPVNKIANLSIERAKVYFSGANLLKFTKMVETCDPELSGPSAYSLFRSFTLGANFDF